LIASDHHEWVSNDERKSNPNHNPNPDPNCNPEHNPNPNPTVTDHPDLTINFSKLTFRSL